MELKPAPPKFLVPFAEKSSRENEDSDLISLWAHLLATASSDYHSRYATYVEILSEIGSDDAKLLSAIWKSTKKKDLTKREIVFNAYLPHTPEQTWHGKTLISLDEFDRHNFLIAVGSYGEKIGDMSLNSHAPRRDQKGGGPRAAPFFCS